MTEQIRNYCLSLKGTTESIKWEDHVCFSIGEKMYCVLNPDGIPVSASFKADEGDFDELTSREGLIPAPYLARYKWVHVDNVERIGMEEWKKLLGTSCRLIFEKLPAKTRKEIESM